MNTNTLTQPLENVVVNVKLKLAALWIALMFLYVYVDVIGFYKPGTIADILIGKVWTFDITQTWAISGLVMMTIPSLMIVLCLTLAPKTNRWVNIVVASLYILISAGNVIGESWIYYFFGAAVEVVLLIFVVWYAWTWPKQNI